MTIALLLELDAPPANGLTMLDDLERRAVEAVLAVHGGNIKATARRLGIARSTLQRKMRRWALGGWSQPTASTSCT